MENVTVKIALCAIQQRLTCLAYTAAQHHDFRVYGAADIGKELTHVVVNLLQNGKGGAVACLSCVEDILAG